jgi:hypothetical protein
MPAATGARGISARWQPNSGSQLQYLAVDIEPVSPLPQIAGPLLETVHLAPAGKTDPIPKPALPAIRGQDNGFQDLQAEPKDAWGKADLPRPGFGMPARQQVIRLLQDKGCIAGLK